MNLPKSFQFLYKIPFFIPKKVEESDKVEENQLLPVPIAANSALEKSKKLGIGLACAFTTGVFAGSLMVPAQFVPEEQRGWDYVLSFAIGSEMTAVFMTVVLIIYHYIRTRTLVEFHFKAVLLPGLLSGALWSAGNAFRVFAVLYLGMAVGFPLTQLGLVLAAIIGMVFFKEIASKFSIFIFVVSTCCIAAGALLLSFFGRGFGETSS